MRERGPGENVPKMLPATNGADYAALSVAARSESHGSSMSILSRVARNQPETRRAAQPSALCASSSRRLYNQWGEFQLRVEFDSNRDGDLASIPIVGWRRKKIDPKFHLRRAEDSHLKNWNDADC